jgi:hypothetical protein
MRAVAGQAFSSGIEPAVFHCSLRYLLFLFLMAAHAQIAGALSYEVIFKIAAVRIVALRTACLDRGVGEFAVFHVVCLIAMTCEAYIVT